MMQLTECHSEMVSAAALYSGHPDPMRVSLQVLAYSLQANATILPQTRPHQVLSTFLPIYYSFITLSFNIT